MNYLSLESVNKTFGDRTILDKVTFGIDQGQKVALVGVNGSGKSTLLKIVSGIEQADAGDVVFRNDITVRSLLQNPEFKENQTVIDAVFDADDEALKLIHDYQNLLLKIEEGLSDSEGLQPLIDRIDGLNAWDRESQIKQILSKLGIVNFNKKVNQLSGGQQKRVSIAQVLIQRPDLLILDEPTNHLDVVAQNWLEHYLKHYQGSILVISHDRAFLETVTDRTMELKMGDLINYKGNYTFYVQESAARKERQRKTYVSQKKQIEKEKEFINRFRSNIKKAAMVQSRIKALEKMEVVKPEAEEKKIYFRFPPSPPASHKVVEVEGLRKAYDELEVFSGLDLRIEKGDRIAVVGVNGAGKSTLARILAGVEPYQEGTRDVGVNTVIGYFAQHQAEELNPDNEVLAEVEEELHDNPDANPRAALGALLFSGNDVFKKTSVLSGGERNRVALAKLLMKPCNFLIMDEPTNHLDIRSKEVLQEALNLFDGTAIIVSHDRSFLDSVVTKVLEVSPNKTRMLTCNVTEYMERLQTEEG